MSANSLFCLKRCILGVVSRLVACVSPLRAGSYFRARSVAILVALTSRNTVGSYAALSHKLRREQGAQAQRAQRLGQQVHVDGERAQCVVGLAGHEKKMRHPRLTRHC
jgi:hypothetical protein